VSTTPTTEELLARLIAAEDRLAIRDVSAAYCHFIDDQNWDGLRSIFTEDIVWEGLETHTGRETVIDFLDSLVPGVMEHAWHRAFGETITSLAADWATTRAQMDAPCVIDGVPMLCAGRYDDTFRKGDDGQWRLAHRKMTFYYFNPFSEGYHTSAALPGAEPPPAPVTPGL
jgi:ketosteroid isomerase-like protein